MNTINRDYRLDDVLDIIRKAHNVTVPDLMILTGKSRATIKRDIRMLKRVYPQIQSKPGNTGGIIWEEGKKRELHK